MLVGLPAVSSAQAPPPVSIQGEVMKTWKNGRGEDVVLRRGYWSADNPRGGFGYEKILRKHEITDLGVVESIVRKPDTIMPQANGRSAHESIARQFRCSITGCVTVQSVTVRVVIDYREWEGLGQLGIVTAYCDNPDRSWKCPAFVNAAIKP